MNLNCFHLEIFHGCSYIVPNLSKNLYFSLAGFLISNLENETNFLLIWQKYLRFLFQTSDFGQIVFSMEADALALQYFEIGPTSGEITVRSNLQIGTGGATLTFRVNYFGVPAHPEVSKSREEEIVCGNNTVPEGSFVCTRGPEKIFP